MLIFRLLYIGWRVPLFGSNSNNSGKAGTFTINSNNGWSNVNVNISTHLYLKNII
jgi:hypothetical protein